jgi:hypothetical protein
MKIYSFIKKNEIVSFARQWIEPDIMLMKLSSPTRINIICFLSFVELQGNERKQNKIPQDHESKLGTTRVMEE